MTDLEARKLLALLRMYVSENEVNGITMHTSVEDVIADLEISTSDFE